MANAREEGSKPGRPETAAGKLPGVFMIYNLKYRKGEMKDYPVLYTAIIEEVDLLVTGDKDFSDIDIEKPEIMSPAQFMERFL